jgi:hypothetical protein
MQPGHSLPFPKAVAAQAQQVIEPVVTGRNGLE